MAITAYVGLPGSGKSYGVVENVILPAIKENKRIWTNIPLDQEAIKNDFGATVKVFDTQDLLDDPQWFQETFEAGATIVIDEVWRLWPAGLKANNMIEGHKSFLAEHRHMVGSDGHSTEVVLVTQDLGQVASNPRALVESTFRAVKLNSVGSSKKFRIDIYQGSVTGPNPPQKSRLRQVFSSYKKEVYQYYQSQTMSEAGGHGVEGSSDKRANIFNSKLVRYAFPAFIVVGLAASWAGLSSFWGSYASDPEGDASPEVVQEGTKSSGSPSSPAPIRKRHQHFYSEMEAYIAWNMGESPYIDYKLGFRNGEYTVVLGPRELGKLGYRLLGYDQCYVQLEGYGDRLDIFCEEQDDNETQESDNNFGTDLLPI